MAQKEIGHDEKTKQETTPDRALNYEICENRILIDGYFVCDAPERHNNRRKFTPAQKLTFCKAVIWQLMNDEGSLRDQVSRFGTSEIPRLVREEIRAPVDDITQLLPDSLSSYVPGALSGFPEFVPYDDDQLCPAERADLMELAYMADDHESDNMEMAEYWPGVMAEIFPAPAIVQKWVMPHLRVSVVEECVPA